VLETTQPVTKFLHHTFITTAVRTLVSDAVSFCEVLTIFINTSCTHVSSLYIETVKYFINKGTAFS